MKVIITKDLGDEWVIDELLEDMAEASTEDRHAAIVELLQEDIVDLIDGATWRFEE